jgi:hypothetical protein
MIYEIKSRLLHSIENKTVKKSGQNDTFIKSIFKKISPKD